MAHRNIRHSSVNRGNHRSASVGNHVYRRRLRVEPLEDRRMLAGVIVGNNFDLVNGNTTSIADLIGNDGGDGISLREAVLAANATAGTDEITFDSALSGATITLGGTELAITQELTIDARALAEKVTINANQLSRVFDITASSGDFAFVGLELTGGKTTVDNWEGKGGALRSLTSGNLTLDHCTISGNIITGNYSGGGGVFAYGDLTITESIISGNSATGSSSFGGGLETQGIGTITQSTVSGNTATGSGGGIFAWGAMTITQSTVSANSAVGDGGGIVSGTLTLTQTTVSGNTATGSGGGGFALGAMTITQSTVSANSAVGNGGGIVSGTLTLTQTTVSGNTATGSGGGVFAWGDMIITQSTVSANSAVGDGGGIVSGTLTLTQTTVSGNSVSGDFADGGGIYVVDAVMLIQSTVTENHAISSGGGVYQFNATGEYPFSISGSIIAGNTAEFGRDVALNGSGNLTINYSLLTLSEFQTFSGTGNIIFVNFPLDPRLGPLADNGGPTWTHKLLDDSPAANSGDPSIVFDPTEYDQRGAPYRRVVSGRIDMGAFEGQEVPSVVVTTSQDEVDAFDGFTSLREAILYANSLEGADTITFDPGVFGSAQTISMSLGEYEITEALSIDGPGQELLTIDADQQSRVFNFVGTTGYFGISNLSLTGGRTIGDNAGPASNVHNGGAIRSVTNDALLLNRVKVYGNSTTGQYATGGAIFATHFVFISESTISGNSTTGVQSRGGGVHTHGDLTLSYSTVSGNSTSGSNAHGGGVSASGINSFQSTISGNSSADASGGGLYSTFVFLRHSTITNNHAAFAGGVKANAWLNADHSIIAENTADPGFAPDLVSGNVVFNVEYSLIGNTLGLDSSQLATLNASVGNLLNVAPRLLPLADNGGRTLTHMPTIFSPAINAGDPGVAGVPLFDQRGEPFGRISGNRIDIGAVEWQLASPADVYVVDTIADELDGDISEGNFSLREALTLANLSPERDTITFAAALSGQTIMLNGTELAITEALTIDATALADRIIINAQHQSRIFNITASSGDFTLAGLTLTGGVWGSGIGGAVRSFTTGNLMLDRTTVSENSALSGGGISARGPVTLTQSIVNDNRSERGGGGISSPDDITLIESTVSGNVDTVGEGGYGDGRGGGVLSLGNVTLIRSTVSGNAAQGIFCGCAGSQLGGSSKGGGIFATGDVTLTESTVSGNSTTGDRDAVGGGIFAYGNVTLTRSTISGNSTVGGNGSVGFASGGGVWAANIVTLTQSTISENSVTGNDAQGGGVFGFYVTVTESTISGNSTAGASARGGGIFSWSVMVTNSTVTNNQANHATATGGGVFQQNSSLNAPFTISGSIIVGNTAGGGGLDLVKDPQSTLTIEYSLIGTGITPDAGDNNIATDSPILGLLADNGGPTMTHALLPGSPAINAGDPSILYSASEFDQRGVGYFRVSGGRIDIGAYEVQAAPPSLPGDYNDDGTVNAADYVLWRDTLGSTTNLVANGDDSNSIIDEADYDVWQANFGESQGEASGLSSVHPIEGGGGESFSAMEAAFALFDAPISGAKTKLVKPVGRVPTLPDNDALLLLAMSFAASETEDNDDSIKFGSEEKRFPDDDEWAFGDTLLSGDLLEVL